jgi:hypothetical protein
LRPSRPIHPRCYSSQSNQRESPISKHCNGKHLIDFNCFSVNHNIQKKKNSMLLPSTLCIFPNCGLVFWSAY